MTFLGVTLVWCTFLKPRLLQSLDKRERVITAQVAVQAKATL